MVRFYIGRVRNNTGYYNYVYSMLSHQEALESTIFTDKPECHLLLFYCSFLSDKYI